MLGQDKLHEFNLNDPVNQVPSGFPEGVGNGWLFVFAVSSSGS